MAMRYLVVLVVGLWLSGCSAVTNYNPEHIPDTPSLGTEMLDGKALIYTEKDDDSYIYKGSPTSLTGAATDLSMELGKMTREIAVKVFSKAFKDGAEAKNSQADAANYALVVKPKVSSFTYEFNQLKNIGFAITPQAKMSLNVCLVDAKGTVYFEKDYDSEVVDGGSYMIALESPGEKINRLAHVILHDLMVNASLDAVKEVKIHSAGL